MARRRLAAATGLITLLACGPAPAQTPVAASAPDLPLGNGLPRDDYGYSASLDGAYLVVGAPGRQLAGHHDAGIIRLYTRLSGGWTELTPIPDPFQTLNINDRFGHAVLMDHPTFFVGAPSWGSVNRGRVFVYKLQPTFVSTLVQTLIADDPPEPGDDRGFGATLLKTETELFVGAPAGDGAVYVFEHDGEEWVQTQKITTSLICSEHCSSGSSFGSSLAYHAGYLFVGAPEARLGDLYHAGAVQMFTKVGGQWELDETIVSSSFAEDERFGQSLSAAGGVLAVGADDSTAYTYELIDGEWVQLRDLFSPIGPNSRFGERVATDGSRLVVGGPAIAVLYERSGDEWEQVMQLRPVEAGVSGPFTGPVLLDGPNVFLAAPRDDTFGNASGAVYVIDTANPECSIADVSSWFGVLDFDDISAFLTAFAGEDPVADLASPFGVFDFSDVVAFLSAFAAGCP